MLKILLTLLISSHITKYSSNAAKCVTNQDNWCVFNKISTTELFTHFHPSAEVPINIEKIKFQTSRLHTLTNKICEKFVNLEELDVSGVSLRKIENEAFDQCIKLKMLDLSNNHLTKINSNSFKNNKYMESLNFNGNYLKDLDLSLLNGLTQLAFLDVSQNRLQIFSVYKSPKLASLRELYLQNNELTELNEHAILQKFRNLEKFGVGGNSLHCKRVDDMNKLFEEYDIAMIEEMVYRNGKNCLSEQQWIRIPCETKFASIRDEWMWLKSQNAFDDEGEEDQED